MISTIYNLTSKPIYGRQQGTCRILGVQSNGVNFDDWVKPTFTNYEFLYPGDIISNQAMYFFDEKNHDFTGRTGKDKQQKCRSYSHFLHEGVWHIMTKADLQKMSSLILSGCEWVCVANSGQKHLVWLTQKNMWNFEGVQIEQDIELLSELIDTTNFMYTNGISKKMISGDDVNLKAIRDFGFDEWFELDQKLSKFRGSKIFDFAVFLTHRDESLLREKITYQKTLFE